MKAAKPLLIAPNLHLIPLDQSLSGFTTFIGAWLYQGTRTYLVDPGPAATVPVLIQSLNRLSVDRIDAILLTHIHIDHAGGIGDLSLHFKETPVLCHPAAVKHVAAPDRLWEGSLKSLGDTARAYGPILPVPENRLIPTSQCPFDDILPMETPGHAVHHVSFLADRILFAGEAAGVYWKLKNGRTYLRPATPPRFFLDTSIKSLESLMAAPHDLLCYGHFGATRRTPEYLDSHREQIHRWARIIERQRSDAQGTDIVTRCIEKLRSEDPLMAAWDEMPAPIRERETTFLKNSVRGFLGYFENLEEAGPIIKNKKGGYETWSRCLS